MIQVIHLIAQFSGGMLFCNLVLLSFSISLMLCGQLDILCCSIKNLKFFKLIDNGTTINGLRDTLFKCYLSPEKELEKFRYGREMIDELLPDDKLVE